MSRSVLVLTVLLLADLLYWLFLLSQPENTRYSTVQEVFNTASFVAAPVLFIFLIGGFLVTAARRRRG